MSPNYGFPSREMQVLGRNRAVIRHDRTSKREWALLIVLAVILAVVLLAPRNTETVHAEEKPHQNDYYCQLIKEQGDHILLEKNDELKSLCASWGVEL